MGWVKLSQIHQPQVAGLFFGNSLTEIFVLPRFREDGKLDGGFKYFLLCSPLLGEMIQFDQFFSNGLKPATSKVFPLFARCLARLITNNYSGPANQNYLEPTRDLRRNGCGPTGEQILRPMLANWNLAVRVGWIGPCKWAMENNACFFGGVLLGDYILHNWGIIINPYKDPY